MSKVTVICVCILVSALAIIVRMDRFERSLARAAYAACNSTNRGPLYLVRSESSPAP